MITIDITERTVGEIAAEVPLSIRVFESWKIDYCCGGRTPLADACAAAGKSIDAFLTELESMSAAGATARDWSADSLAVMATNIVANYHQYTREELDTLDPIANKVLGVHGSRHPELSDVVTLLQALRVDMLPHMLKEEQILFPFVTQLEEAAASQRPAPVPFFGTVKNPVRKMMEEHDRVGDLLAAIRDVTSNYTVPDDACFSFRELYRRLTELETLTHEHIHVENNLFFPRAVALEEQSGRPADFGSCNH